MLAAGRVRSKKEKRKTKTRNPTTQKIHHEINPQQPGDRDHLETACDETRPTREPMLARFLHKSRVCGNRPRLYAYVYTRTTTVPLVYVLVLFFPASAASFSTVIPRMYLRFRGYPVVLDTELSVSARYQKTRRVLLRARRLLLLLLLSAESRGVWCAA